MLILMCIEQIKWTNSKCKFPSYLSFVSRLIDGEYRSAPTFAKTKRLRTKTNLTAAAVIEETWVILFSMRKHCPSPNSSLSLDEVHLGTGMRILKI